MTYPQLNNWLGIEVGLFSLQRG